MVGVAVDRVVVAPGAVHVPAWLDEHEQRELVAACREWSKPPAGMRAVRTRNGTMSARTACLGWYWYPYRYSRTADDEDGAPVKAFPAALTSLGRRALSAAGLDWPGYSPDVALINYYGPDARMGLHQDRDERSVAPVVSISLGDAALFRFGNPQTRGRPWTDLELRSGDLFVFGGPSRLAYHGVLKIRAGTSPDVGLSPPAVEERADGPVPLALTGLAPAVGRVNITLRESGLD
jgi:alkylated DNA repair protein (DNA oxidative demethylase)